MLFIDLPVRDELRGRPLRFTLTPMMSTCRVRGTIALHVTVETVEDPIEREDLDLEPCDEALWIHIHQLFRAGAVFVVPKRESEGSARRR